MGEFSGKCGSCKFWERWGSEAGGCKRNPPIMPNVTVMGRQRDYDRIEVTMSTGSKPYWPNTEQNDWCGEYQYGRAAPKSSAPVDEG